MTQIFKDLGMDWLVIFENSIEPETEYSKWQEDGGMIQKTEVPNWVLRRVLNDHAKALGGLRFYSKQEHWMSTDEEGAPNLLIALHEDCDNAGYAVAQQILDEITGGKDE